MSDLLFKILLSSAGVVAVGWIIRAFMVELGVRQRIILTPDSQVEALDELPRISVIVAAKDEEANIESCVRSLLDQDYANYEVIIVDDRSTDRTPQILHKLEQQAGQRLKVIRIDKLPRGWCGKANAMRVGVEAASGDWFCFSDADCRQTSRRSLSVTLADALRNKTDLLTVTPVLDVDTLWDKLTQPVCVEALVVWHQPRQVNDPHHSAAYANGAFMLMSRTCLEAIGGYERVRSDVNEDIQIARAVKSAGFNLRMVENEGLYRTRMYRRVSDAWRGWSRIFGCLDSTWKLGVTLFSIVVSTLFPWAMLLLCLIQMRTAAIAEQPLWQSLAAAWGTVLIIHQLTSYRFYRTQPLHQLWSLTYGLGALATAGMLINSLSMRFGLTKTSWRGTVYQPSGKLNRTQTALEIVKSPLDVAG